MKPFIANSLVEPKGIDKLLKRIPTENFLIEVNNLLANNSLDEISAGQIQQLADKYKLKDASLTFKSELVRMLNAFLTQHLGASGDKYSDINSAKKLQSLLGLSDYDFQKAYLPHAMGIFREQVSNTLYRAKKRGDEEDTQFEQLKEQLGLTERDSNAVIGEVVNAIVQKSFDNMISDRQYSPDEKEEFEKLCQQYGANAGFDDATEKLLEKYEKFWQIENSDLPVYETDIFLQKDEVCHYIGLAKLFELRTKTEGYKYRGPAVRLRITKSLYYRTGDIKTTRETKDVITLIDSGDLYVTNKRILFNGGKGNKVIKYSQIIDLTPYTDGVKIVRDTGKEINFQLSEQDGEVLTATITRLIGDQQ
jgi:hypothetical protein